MRYAILLAGIGGQGVLFAHNVLAECALAQGLNVTGAETHGMSQRGGSVVSHLKIGDTSAPMIRQATADFVIAFDAAEAYRALPFLKRGGALVVNAAPENFPDAQVQPHLDAWNITVRACDADAIARNLERASAANVALLGFATTCENFPFTADALRASIARVAHPRFVALNEKAFEAGIQIGNLKLEVRDWNPTSNLQLPTSKP
ncbi:MAG: indolepyruvate oxidoreductase subunit beta [Chloroflexi bacterium]|nr:indolepyruvate oxidoreductase subunit beta [Chloroflexota bacterium]